MSFNDSDSTMERSPTDRSPLLGHGVDSAVKLGPPLHQSHSTGDSANDLAASSSNDRISRHYSLAPQFVSFAGALRNASAVSAAGGKTFDRSNTHDSISTKSYDAVKTSFENESESELDHDNDDDDNFSRRSDTWDDPMQTHTLHPDFDVSVKHLEQLFNVLDTNGDGELTYAQMKLGFESMNAFPDLETEQLDKLIVEIDTDNSGTVSLTEFVVSMHEYAALALGDEAVFVVFVHDYGPSYYKRTHVSSDLRPASPNTDNGSVASYAMSSAPPTGLPTHIGTYSSAKTQFQGAGGPSAAYNNYSTQQSEMLLRVASRVNIPINGNIANSPRSRASTGTSTHSSSASVNDIKSDSFDRLTVAPASASQMTLHHFLSKGIPKNAQTAVRWVSLAGRNASVFVRMANKFGLHPLAITDVLEDRQRAKLEVYANGDLQIMLGVISMKEGRNDRVLLRHINIFLINQDTVFTVENVASDFMPELMNRVKYSGSKLRLNDARYLVHALIDRGTSSIAKLTCACSWSIRMLTPIRPISSVDQLVPIIKLFSRDLNFLYKVLHGREKESFGLEHMKRMQSIYRQVTQINQWLRPLIGVIKRLKDQFGAEDKELGRYVADLMENVETTREQVKQMEKQAKSLNDDFVNQQQYRMNKVMYFLTMVTTIFIPGQFLSGVYGMNFDNMPELHWQLGYYLWWLGVMGIVACSLTAFYRYRWLGSSDSMIL